MNAKHEITGIKGINKSCTTWSCVMFMISFFYLLLSLVPNLQTGHILSCTTYYFYLLVSILIHVIGAVPHRNVAKTDQWFLTIIYIWHILLSYIHVLIVYKFLIYKHVDPKTTLISNFIIYKYSTKFSILSY